MYHYDRYKSSDACPVCGNEVPASDLFCERCGMRIYTHLPQEESKVDTQLNLDHPKASGSMIHPSDARHSLSILSEMPELNTEAASCDSSLKADYPDIDRLINDFRERVFDDLNDILDGDFKDREIFETLGTDFIEERRFGLDKCTEAAKRIFNIGVILSWGPLHPERRQEMIDAYARAVADAFELVLYLGIEYKKFKDPDTLGENNGNGVLYLSYELLDPEKSPFRVMDTITHELRHQYQHEAIRGLHKVSEDVVKEWITADQIYNGYAPCCYNPWGYNYNPLEIDARYAGETVVRNVSHDLFNAKSTKSMNVINKQQLRARLVQEGYSGALLEKTTDDLLKLDGKAAEMLHSWLDNGIKPEFDDIEGLNSRLLREHYQMKEPAIILSYGMLMNNPVQNSRRLKSVLFREQRPYK